MANTYRSFLKELADHLTSNDVETIKFLLGDSLPAGKAEKQKSAMKLLEAMNNARLIGYSNVNYLISLFDEIPRRDLIPKLEKYKENISIESVDELKMPKEIGENQDCLMPTENSDISDTDSSRTSSPVGSPEKDHNSTKYQPIIPSVLDYPRLLPAEAVNKPEQKPSLISKKIPEKVKLMTPGDFRNTRSLSKNPDKAKTIELPHPNTTTRQRSSQQVRPEEYCMDGDLHGDCIIFSNRFDEDVRLDKDTVLKQRVGTEKDVLSLTDTFEYLKFKVTLYKNLSAVDIIKTLKIYAQQKEQEKNECFVVCMLSHGYEGGIYGNDGVKISSKEIKKIFAGDNCRSLINKPKLFFIQACQGESDGKYVRLESDGGSMPFTQDHLGEEGTARTNSSVYEEVIPVDADFMFFMATTPGTISWRCPEEGSWFIQTLCEVFMDKASSWSLMEMLLRVNNLIAQKNQTLDGGTRATQMPNIDRNTLRKTLHFYPEECVEDS